MSSPFRYQSVLTFWLILIGFLLFANRPNVGHTQQEELKVDASTEGQGLSLESATLSSRSLLQGDPLIVIRCMVKNSAKEPLTGIVSARLAGNLTDDDRYQLTVPPEQTLTCELTVRPPLQLPESR
ncbi:MAG: hypothetical protein LW724_19405, partial [Planctomycetaceae bacterium]|nr:hypothetical protein [Planctomycetaceae bacterium]